ncbi:MAG: AtpZ/AtpI family protein [Flavobacteriaceae bacterium]
MKKQPNKWLIFSSLAFQIAIIMYVMVRLGHHLDSQSNPEKSLFTLLTSGLGLLAILWLIYKQSKKLWEKD